MAPSRNRIVYIGGVAAVLAAVGAFLVLNKPKTDPDRAARRIVKTASDPDAAKIDRNIQDITIEDLVATKAPERLGKRVAPFETSMWRVKGTLETIELKKDGDFYMVVKGEKGGRTVVEVPDPELCKDSAFHDEIAATRKKLEDAYHPTSDKQEVNKPTTIEGVGFLGWGSNGRKGSSGLAGPRIMPGTDITVGP